MPSGKPIYQDLLVSLTNDELVVFMSQLKIVGLQKRLPVTFSTEVDQPVYCNNIYYHSALCCAVANHYTAITQALLDADANPNIADLHTVNGSALLIASQSKEPSARILLQMLLATPNIELYAIDGLGQSVFSLANDSNESFVLMLLASDPVISRFAEEEKQAMSRAIAEAIKSKSTYQTNSVICQILNKAYLSEDEHKLEVNNKITEAYPLIASGQPIGNIVSSYFFQRKPHSLKVMENWVLQNEPQKEDEMPCHIS